MSVIFELLAARLGAHWLVSAAERARAGSAFAPLIVRLLEKVSGVVIEATMAGIVLLDIVIPRLRMDAELARAKTAPPAPPEAPRVEGEDPRPPEPPPLDASPLGMA